MTDNSANPEDRGSPVALIIAVAAALGWSVYTFRILIRGTTPYLRAGDYASSLGMLLGHVVVIAGLVGVVVYFAAPRRWKPRKAGPFFAILFATVLASNFAGVMLARVVADRDDDRAQLKIAQTEMADTFRKAIATQRPSDVDTRIKATGEAGIIERLTKTLTIAALTDKQNYHAEMAALGFPGFLAPQALASQGGLVNAQARLADARKVIAKYAALSRTRILEFRAAIAASQLSDSSKSELLKDVDENSARQQATRDRIWELEDSIIAEHGRRVADLEHPKGHWALRDNIWRFSNPADLAAFRTHEANIRALQTEERALLAAAKDRVTKAITPPPG